jgi:hypothetical protein
MNTCLKCGNKTTGKHAFKMCNPCGLLIKIWEVNGEVKIKYRGSFWNWIYVPIGCLAIFSGEQIP